MSCADTIKVEEIYTRRKGTKRVTLGTQFKMCHHGRLKFGGSDMCSKSSECKTCNFFYKLEVGTEEQHLLEGGTHEPTPTKVLNVMCLLGFFGAGMG